MIHIHPNTLASQGYWRTVIAEVGLDSLLREQAQRARSQIADHIHTWADRVPKYYQGSSEAVESLIDSLALLKIAFSTGSKNLESEDRKDWYASSDIKDPQRSRGDYEDPYPLRNLADLKTLGGIMDCAKGPSTLLDGLHITLEDFREKLCVRRAAEPVFIKWLHAQRQSIVDAPYSPEDHESLIQDLLNTQQRVDDAVHDFEMVSHNVMLALQPMIYLVRELCECMEGHSADETAMVFSWCKCVSRFVDDMARNFRSAWAC